MYKPIGSKKKIVTDEHFILDLISFSLVFVDFTFDLCDNLSSYGVDVILDFDDNTQVLDSVCYKAGSMYQLPEKSYKWPTFQETVKHWIVKSTGFIWSIHET